MNKANENSRKKAAEAFYDKAVAVHGNKYDYSKVEYTTTHQKVIIICPKHGEFQQSPAKHLSGRGCPQCAAEKRASVFRKRVDNAKNNFLDKVKTLHPKYDFSKTKYVNAHEKVTVTCQKHGDFEIRPHALLNGQGCGKCHQENLLTGDYRRKSQEGFINQAKIVHNGKYDYSRVDYVHGKTKVEIICTQHGSFMQRPNDHLHAHGCPRCSMAGPSREEDAIRDWLKEVLGEDQVIQSDRKTISPYELDLLVPSHDLAIEYNGDYYHSDRFKDADYHQKKKLAALGAGVDLIHVYEWMWKQRSPQIKGLILSRLGRVKSVYARKCEVKEIDRETADRFCESFHIQGSAGSSVRLGLFFEGSLVGCFTAARPRFAKDCEWEIVRICFQNGFRVVGGAGKMLKFFEREYCNSGDKILSYAQLDWSSGGVYKALGFALSHTTPPGYHWIHTVTGAALPRYRTQKRRLARLLGEGFDPEETEEQNMIRGGWFRVFNSGSGVYVRAVQNQ